MGGESFRRPMVSPAKAYSVPRRPVHSRATNNHRATRGLRRMGKHVPYNCSKQRKSGLEFQDCGRCSDNQGRPIPAATLETNGSGAPSGLVYRSTTILINQPWALV